MCFQSSEKYLYPEDYTSLSRIYCFMNRRNKIYIYVIFLFGLILSEEFLGRWSIFNCL